MGYMRHHAIIVTSFDDDEAKAAHTMAETLGMSVTDIVSSPVNHYLSFMVATDGSKEGWTHSEDGDARRRQFIAWMDTRRYGDGSGPLCWVEVQYGDDERETAIVSHSDEEARQTAGVLS